MKKIMLHNKRRTCRKLSFHWLSRVPLIALVAIIGLALSRSGNAADYYWDSNGTTAGAGADPSGTWGVDSFWSTSAAGTSSTANTTITSSDRVFFSAGSDTTGAYTVTLDGVKNAQVAIARSGSVTLSSGTLVLAKSTSRGSADFGLRIQNSGANLTVNSALTLDNSGAGFNYLNFNTLSGSTITLNGSVVANTLNSGSGNQVFIDHKGAGTVIINTDLGADTNLKSALNASGAINGAATGGVLTLNGNQDLPNAGVSISDTGKTGVINLGGSVNLSNKVKIGAISITHTTNNLAGATININSDVDMGSNSMTVRSGGVVNVAGRLVTTGDINLGQGNASGGGGINILNGGEFNSKNIVVAKDLVLSNAGTLNAGVLTLGENTTGGNLVLGNLSGTGNATFTGLVTSGTAGSANAIVGGNSSISTLTLNIDSSRSFSGNIGGNGMHENNLELIKNGAANQTFSGNQTYLGNTTIHAGKIILDTVGSFTFTIGADGVNNGILGTGAVNLDGAFAFDLSGAAAVGTWNIVDVGNLTAVFSSSFNVTDFTDIGNNLWTKTVGSSVYTFSEVTGLLTAIPEPHTGLLLLGFSVLLLLQRKRVQPTIGC